MRLINLRDNLQRRSRSRALRLLALAGVLAWVVWRSCVLKYCVLDPDIWWHLRVGDWILANRAVPHTGIFSRTAANLPWVAYSWGYEVLLSLAFRWFGLYGIGVFGVALTVLVACAILLMLRRLSGNFWVACALGCLTCVAMLFTMMPRPHFFSIALFAMVITVIFEAQRRSSLAPLHWLPLVFLIWTNLHIQFVYGLFVLGLFVGVNLLQRVAGLFGVSPPSALAPSLPSLALALLFALSFLATLIGPNTIRVYGVIFEYSREHFGYSYIRELQALDFRFADHYAQLFLTGAAFFALGCRKKLDPFKLLLLAACALVAFRTTRDGWFICIPAAACIADAFYRPASESEQRVPPAEYGVLFATAAFLIALILPLQGFTRQAVDAAVGETFPVDAANFLRLNAVPGPLYNSFNWGGFLIWYLPDYPVSIDGRNDLYGDKVDERSMGVQNGLKPYADDADFRNSNVMLLSNREYLATRLRRDPGYRMVYQDPIAVIFVPQSSGAPKLGEMWP